MHLRAAKPLPDITPAWVEAIDAAISSEPSFRPATPRALADMLMRGIPYTDAIARVVAPSLFEIAAPRGDRAGPRHAPARPGIATDGTLTASGIPQPAPRPSRPAPASSAPSPPPPPRPQPGARAAPSPSPPAPPPSPPQPPWPSS